MHIERELTACPYCHIVRLEYLGACQRAMAKTIYAGDTRLQDVVCLSCQRAEELMFADQQARENAANPRLREEVETMKDLRGEAREGK